MKKTIILIVCALIVSLGATATVGIVFNNRTYSADETYSAKEIDALVLSLQQQMAADKNLLDDEINKLKKDYKEKDAELLASISENQKAIAALDVKYAVEIALLKQADTTNQTAISDLTTAYNAKVAAFESSIETANATIAANKTELENKITALTELYQTKTAEIDALLETIQSTTATQSEKIAELAEEIITLQNATRITAVAFNDNGDLLITFGDGSTQTVNAPEKHVHSYGDYKCFTSGTTVYCEERLFYRICTECNVIEWKNGDYSDHNWNTVTTAPTCQAQGYDTKTCSICGKVEKLNYTAKIDHAWEATYSYDSDYHWYDCGTCDDVKDKSEHTVNDNGICTVCNNLVGATAGIAYTLSSDGTYYSVTDYQGTATRVRVADTYNNLPVTEIASGAFYGNETATEVFIPDSVTTIASTAFKDCVNLTSIRLSDNLTQIGDSAFYNCKKLTSAKIPNSVTSIGDSAFYGCSNLEGVYITDIAAWCNIEFKDWSSNPLSYAPNLYLNNVLVSDLVIPNTVTAIKKYAFYSASCLTNITIPDSVTSISKTAFIGCTNLIKKIKGIHYVGNWVIDSDTDIVNANITDGTRSIASSVFYGCSSLTSIAIPDSVTSIGSSAFLGCTSLINVTIGNGMASIGDWAFYNCASLKGVYITDIAAWCNIEFGDSSTPLVYANNLYLNNELVTDLVIPNNVTAIKNYAFSEATCLTSVTISDNVSSIGDESFYYCTNITSVTIPDSVTSIGEGAFYGCVKLVEVINKSSLNITKGKSDNGDVARYALNVKTEGASDIVNVNDYLFYTYNNVNYFLGYVGNDTELVLPDNYNGQNYEIYKYAFYKCNSLTNITIPDSVTSIGDLAFYNCSGLTSITIPDSVTSIAKGAFYGCSGLTSIVFSDTTTWYRATSSSGWENKTGGTETDVTVAATNATYFTSTYDKYYWYKK